MRHYYETLPVRQRLNQSTSNAVGGSKHAPNHESGFAHNERTHPNHFYFMNIRSSASLALLLGAVVLSAPTHRAVAQSTFEGVVNCIVSNPAMDDEKHELNMSLKGDKIAIEMDAGMQGKVRIIEDNANKKMTILMDAQKMAMTTEMKEAKKSTESADDVDLKATGKKETINGHPSEEFTGDLKDKGIMHIWLTKDFQPDFVAAFLKGLKGARKEQSARQDMLMQKMRDKGMFFTRISVIKDGSEVSAMDIVKIERKSLSNDLFTVPADYKTMALPSGPGGMGGSHE